MNISVEKLIKILTLIVASGLIGGNADKLAVGLAVLQFVQGDVNYQSLADLIQKNVKSEDAAKVALAVQVLQIMAEDEK